MHAFKSLLAVALASVLFIGGASANDSYPSKPVSIIVPFAPGGGSDNVSRYIATRLSEKTKATFPIDNRPGAGTNIGNEAAARAAPDGQTLLFGQVALSINPFVYKKLRYDSEKDFVPVVLIATSPTVLVVTKDFPEMDLKGVIRYIRANPGKVNFASGGKGTSVHLAGELFRSMINADMIHVPYKGSSPAMTDLIGGQIPFTVDTVAAAIPQVKSGKVKAIAVTTAKRSTLLPDVPTAAESGYPGIDADTWLAVVAPRGLPADVKQKLERAMGEVMADPDTRKHLQNAGFEPLEGNGAAVSALINKELPVMRATAQRANITAD